MKHATIVISIALLATLGFAHGSENFEIRGPVVEVVNGVEYVWGPQEFGGFYYGVNQDLGAESLQIQIRDGSVEPGDAKYRSEAQDVAFENEGWGNYRVLVFLGQKYFAGYGTTQISSACNCLEDGILRQILIDSADRQTLGSDEDLLLEDGYNIRFSEDEAGVKVSLYKDTRLVDTTIINPPETYVYAKNVADQDIAILAVQVVGNVKLKPTSYYTVKGVFQISEEPFRVESGSEYGLMDISSAKDDEVVMTNSQGIEFVAGKDIELIDGIKIKTADQGFVSAEHPLRFYVYKDITEPGTYEIRSSIAEVVDGMTVEWDISNFAGFHYDLDDDIGTERIIMTITDGALDEPCGVRYETVAQEDDFALEDWGSFYTIPFMGEEYFAAYVENGRLYYDSEDTNLMVDEQLSRMLVNSAEPLTIKSGDVLKLEEGFEAKLFVDDSCEKAFLELCRDGNLIEMDYFDVPGTYAYTTNLGESQNVVILALHVAEVNCTGDRTCTVDGIWQISDTLTDVEEDSEYDKMTIQTVDSVCFYVMMDNEDNKITLNRNMDTSLIGDIKIKTADQDEISAEAPLRWYIYEEVIIEDEES